MRAAFATLALVGLLAGCTNESAGSAEGSCAALLDWNGVRYQVSGHRLPPELGDELGTGVEPGCDDGGGAVGERSVTVYEVVGVDPSVAVALADMDAVYLAPAYSRPGALYRGDPWRYEGFYFRVESPEGERFWEWAGSSRLATGSSGPSAGLAGCNPFQPFSGGVADEPSTCPAD